MWRLCLMALTALTTGIVAWAQSTKIDASSQTRNIDFSNAPATRPAKTGTTVPSACLVGELFYKTDATPGANLYGCTATDTWTALSGGSGGGTAGVAPADSTMIVVTDQGTGEQLLSVNPAAVGTLMGNNDFTGANKLGMSYLSIQVNNSSSGTVVNRLAMLASDGTAQVAPPGTGGKILGVVVSGAGTSASARIAVQGLATCEFDGPTTAGHYVQLSSSPDGKCTDAGASLPPSGQVLGFVTSTNGGPGVYGVLLHPEARGGVTATAEHQVNWVGTCDGGSNFARESWNRDLNGITNAFCWFDGFTEGTSPYASYSWTNADNGYAYSRFVLPLTWQPGGATRLTLFLSEAYSGDGLNLGWSAQTACIGNKWGNSANPVTFNNAQTGSFSSTGAADSHVINVNPLTVTGCDAGEVMVVRFRRDNSIGGNSGAWLLLLGATLTYTRSL